MRELPGHGPIYEWDEVDLSWMGRVKTVKRRGKSDNKKTYLNLIMTFDIETTDDPDRELAFMWRWQFAILGAPGADEIVTGRNQRKRIEDPIVIFGSYWPEFISFLQRLRDAAPPDVTLIIFVHNLSYEYQFCNWLLPIKSGFVVGDKISRLDMEGIEFRCSYLATNKSLYLLTAGKVPHEKAKGDLDFRLYREPGCATTAEEDGYCYNDVAGLAEAIKLDLVTWRENLAGMPMTSTGHVRKDINRIKNGYMVKKIKYCEQRWHMAKILHKLFRGGDCHGNRDELGIIHRGVDQFDKKSSYPAMLVCKKYPMGYFVPVAPERWEMLCATDKYAGFALINIRGLRIKKHAPDPYIARAKVESVINDRLDNGRILFADSVTLWAVDLDWLIIKDAYEWDSCEIHEAYGSYADYLPKAFTDLIIGYFFKKETLALHRKQAREELGEDSERYKLLSAEYEKMKNLINSLYGCLAEWIHPDELEYSEDLHNFSPTWYRWRESDGPKTAKDKDAEEVDELERQAWIRRNKSRLPYQWGVWCTAWARYEYYQGIKCCEIDDPESETGRRSLFIYGDTDSNKFLHNDQVIANFDKLNKRIRQECEDQPYTKGFVEVGGKRIYLGAWEDEGRVDLFRAWGAKKYGCRFANGKIKLTVAGLNKDLGGKYVHMLGGLKAFEPISRQQGLVFPEGYAGRLVAHYSPPTRPYMLRLRSGQEILTAGCVRLVPTTYTLGGSDPFNELLEMSRYSRHKIAAD